MVHHLEVRCVYVRDADPLLGIPRPRPVDPPLEGFCRCESLYTPSEDVREVPRASEETSSPLLCSLAPKNHGGPGLEQHCKYFKRRAACMRACM